MQLHFHQKKRVIKCEVCGIRVNTTSRTQKYCKPCGKKNDRKTPSRGERTKTMAIDPSCRHLAFAIFRGAKLVSTGYHTVSNTGIETRLREVAMHVLHELRAHDFGPDDFIVIEEPTTAQVFTSRRYTRTLQGLSRLWMSMGAIVGATASTQEAPQIHLERASKIPKSLRKRLVQADYAPDLSHVACSYQEHVIDAIYVGHSFISKKRIDDMQCQQ